MASVTMAVVTRADPWQVIMAGVTMAGVTMAGVTIADPWQAGLGGSKAIRACA